MSETKKQFMTRKTMKGLTPSERENAWKQHLSDSNGGAMVTRDYFRNEQYGARAEAHLSHSVKKIFGETLNGADNYTMTVVDPARHISRLPTNDTTKTHVFQTVTTIDCPIDANGSFHIIAARNPAAHVGVRVPILVDQTHNLGQYNVRGGMLERVDLDGAVVDDSLFELVCTPRIGSDWALFASGGLDFSSYSGASTLYNNETPRRDLMPEEYSTGNIGTPARPGDIVTMTFRAASQVLSHLNFELICLDATGARLAGVPANVTAGLGYAGFLQFVCPATTVAVCCVNAVAGTSSFMDVEFSLYHAIAIAMEDCRAIEYHTVANWELLQSAATKVRNVSLALLATQTSAVITKGGQVAIAANSTQNTPKDNVTNVFNYESIIQLPTGDQYNGNLDEGAYAFSKPLGPALAERWFRLGNRSPYKDAYITLAGRIPDVNGRSMRIAVFAVWEITSTQQGLTYAPGPVAPEWGTQMRRVIAHVVPASSNLGHLDLIKGVLGGIKKFAPMLGGISRTLGMPSGVNKAADFVSSLF